jgi:hypothetical protein
LYPNSTKPNLEPQDLAIAFRSLREDAIAAKFIPNHDRNTYGETWLLTGFVTDPMLDKAAIAKSCYRQIADREAKNFQGKGECLGGEIFEFWQPTSSYSSSLPEIFEKHPHVIVWLFPATTNEDIEKIDATIVNTFSYWLRLCHDRNKVAFAYYQSRDIKEKLQKATTEIGEISQSVRILSQKSSLSHLRKLLLNTCQCLVTYSHLLQQMEDQEATIVPGTIILLTSLYRRIRN